MYQPYINQQRQKSLIAFNHGSMPVFGGNILNRGFYGQRHEQTSINGGPSIAMFAYWRAGLHQIHPLLLEGMFPVCSLSQNLVKHMSYHHVGVYRMFETNPASVVI